MKAILVIDMPSKCNECPLLVDGSMYCRGYVPKGFITKMCVEDYVMRGTRHPSCPLRPLPNRMDYVRGADITVNMFANGWNSCLNEIDPEWDKGVKPWR